MFLTLVLSLIVLLPAYSASNLPAFLTFGSLFVLLQNGKPATTSTATSAAASAAANSAGGGLTPEQLARFEAHKSKIHYTPTSSQTTDSSNVAAQVSLGKDAIAAAAKMSLNVEAQQQQQQQANASASTSTAANTANSEPTAISSTPQNGIEGLPSPPAVQIEGQQHPTAATAPASDQTEGRADWVPFQVLA